LTSPVTKRWAALLSLLVAAAITVCLPLLASPQKQKSAPTGAGDGNTRSPHGKLDVPCQNCHTFSGWRPIRQNPEFNHNTTPYPLLGMHKTVTCTQCHLKPIFSNVGRNCSDCHADIHRGSMGAQCDSCHTVKGWATSINQIRDHKNRFPLIGAHAALDCEQCHKGAAVGRFVGLSTDCIGCHTASYMNTTNPNHRSLGFPTQCQQCHTSFSSWQDAKFDHLQFTGFALVGAHATIDCNSCHVGGRFQGTPSTCIGCHQKDYNGAKDPDHLASGFPTTCQQCHSLTTWAGAKFDHSATPFPLTGAHVSVQCSQCHTNGVYKGLPTACVSCHQSDFNKTTNPNHVTAGFPTACETCHTTTRWLGAMFDHASTGFPLTGAHQSVQCTQCHLNGQYVGTPAACIGCHQNDFNKTTNPNHASAGFPTTCQTCHTTTTWDGATFNHTTMTTFPLTGAHASANCQQCHSNGVYKGLPTACVSCHQQDYNKTTNPNHVTAGFPANCETCHTTTQWAGATFNHSTMTTFPLTGAHVNVACTQCHVNGKYAGTPKDCASCHTADFNKTTNPNHAAAAFPTDCSICHTTATWAGAVFDHSKTLFPLTGAHINATCANCHSSGKYAGLSTLCNSCHLTNFNSATNPNHVSAGFPQTCEICHSTSAWQPSTFDHAKTVFPLTGAHVNVACANCHIGGKYAGTPTDCYSCHKSDYTGVSNPNHVAAAFPTTCATCHTTNTWAGATFTHDKFPIYSGSHRGKWTTCADCHTNSSNYAVFSCTNCHQHEKTRTDQQHQGVKNYVYNSPNCYSCHPTGRAG
jgi:hypothetical protein